MNDKVFCIIAIKNNKLLLVRKTRDGKSFWYLPGGKKEKGETDEQCLYREICGEELPNTKMSSLKYFGEFPGITPFGGRKINAFVYTAELEGDITPSAEIDGSTYTNCFGEYQLTGITCDVVTKLFQQELI